MKRFTESQAGPQIAWLIAVVAGLFVSLVLGTVVGGGNFSRMTMIVAGVAVLGLYFGFSRYFWIIAFAAIFLPGGLPFIPMGFRPFEVILLLAVVKFVIEQTVFRKRFPRAGPKAEALILLGILGIMIAHGIPDRFGMRLLGSEIWGGRAYLGITLAILAYFMLQAQPVDLEPWRRLPGVILLIGTIDLGIKLMSKASPTFGELVGHFYSGVIGAAQSTVEEELSRVGFIGNYGYLLICWVFASSSIRDVFLKGQFVKALCLIGGIACCIAAGYRSSLIFGGVLVGLGLLRDFGIVSLSLAPVAALGLFVLSFVNENVVELPKGIQRGLTWVPGKWDPIVKSDADGSVDFRFQVWEHWTKYYFPQAPGFGRGFGVAKEEIMGNLAVLVGYDSASGMPIFKHQDRERAFCASGNLHNGFLSAIDRFGIVGATLIFAWCIVSLRKFYLFNRRRGASFKVPTLRWISLYSFAWIICFPLGALRIEDFLPIQILMMAFFNRLHAVAEAAAAPASQLPDPTTFKRVPFQIMGRAM